MIRDGICFITDSKLSALRNVQVNNTLHGITVSGNLSEIFNVTSYFSQEHGFIFNMVKNSSSTKSLLLMETKIENIVAANNTKSGVFAKLDGKVVENIDLEINNCLLYGNNEHGINIQANATVVLNSCQIIDNRLSGVYISQNAGGRTHLFSSVLSLNREYAVNAYIVHEILLKFSNVTNHNYGYYSYWGRWHTRNFIRIIRNSVTKLNVTFKDNRFVDNTADGIHLYLEYSSRGEYNYTFENNLFSNCNRTLYINDRSYSPYNNPGKLFVHKNTFENIIESVSDMLYMDLRTPSLFTMTQNRITNVTAPSIVKIDGERNSIRGGNVTINDNILKDNSVRASIVIESYQNNISLTRNVFSNFRSDCELEAPNFYISSFSINAQLNYWGDSTGLSVLEKICGFEKNMTKSFVYYAPYYLNETLDGSIMQEQDSFSIDGVLGGEVTGDLTLAMQNSPYKISRSFLIR